MGREGARLLVNLAAQAGRASWPYLILGSVIRHRLADIRRLLLERTSLPRPRGGVPAIDEPAPRTYNDSNRMQRQHRQRG
jgi:hypothetical protein